MNRALAILALTSVSAFATNGAADNVVTWTVRVGATTSGSALLPLPGALFKDRPLPTKGERWRCLADKVLRQDERGNTYSEMSVRCSDGETVVTSWASCQIGAHGTDRFSMELSEKTTGTKNAISAQCDG